MPEQPPNTWEKVETALFASYRFTGEETDPLWLNRLEESVLSVIDRLEPLSNVIFLDRWIQRLGLIAGLLLLVVLGTHIGLDPWLYGYTNELSMFSDQPNALLTFAEQL